MSTTLFAFLAATAAKLAPSNAKIAELEAKIDDLNSRCEGLAMAMNRWRQRCYDLEAEVRKRQDALHPQSEYAQEPQSEYAQEVERMRRIQRMYAQINQPPPAQNLVATADGPFDAFCNCVPARHDLLVNRSEP